MIGGTQSWERWMVAHRFSPVEGGPGAISSPTMALDATTVEAVRAGGAGFATATVVAGASGSAGATAEEGDRAFAGQAGLDTASASVG